MKIMKKLIVKTIQAVIGALIMGSTAVVSTVKFIDGEYTLAIVGAFVCAFAVYVTATRAYDALQAIDELEKQEKYYDMVKAEFNM